VWYSFGVATQNVTVLKKLRPVLSHRVAILNRSSVISDDDAAKMVQALDVAANRDFEPRWHIGCTLKYVEKADIKSWKGYWNVLLLDTSDEAGALGYHDLTPQGLPVSKCFIKTDLQYGAKPSVTVSHELWEMLLDPYINDYCFDPTRNIFVAKEASDAVEADELAYDVQGTAVSDFVLPPFFNPDSKAEDQFSFRKNVHRPFELAPGGYEIIFVPGTGWTQNFNRIDPKHEDRPKVGSRRERRLNRRVWTRSAW
jgi:hypothetical protein